MTNEAPATTAALQGRIADLEQQLKLSDEGVSRLRLFRKGYADRPRLHHRPADRSRDGYV